MKLAAKAFAVIAVAAAAGAVVWLPRSAPASATARSSSLSAIRQSAAPVPRVANGRIFLTSAQLAQARRSGTIDRPVKSLLAIQSPLQYGDYVWNEASVPAGPTWIRIDLRSQLISVFRAGHEIGTAVIVYGGDNKQTPVGTHHILARAKEHRSSLYDAEMPYTLRLTGDGVSIHGSSVRYGAATHGCIGVPLGFARQLFDATHVGDEVVIVRPARIS